MRKRFLIWSVWLVLAWAYSPVYSSPQSSPQGAQLQPFMSGSLARIESAYRGQPFVVSLWSITCPPCLYELDLLGQWRKENLDIPLVLISTDGQDAAAEVIRKLQEANLATADNWIFADDYVEKLRFQIDPAWHGELPRSYLYMSTGQRQAISGALSLKKLLDWRAHASTTSSERH
jgi:thiol-disulfide isomerase/thioredoxin